MSAVKIKKSSKHKVNVYVFIWAITVTILANQWVV